MAGDLEESAGCCPNIGRWAPQFASKKWLDVLQTVFQSGLDILLRVARDLSEDERSILMSEWSKGKLHVIEFLTKKLSFWQELPYVLCALGLEDQKLARDVLRVAFAKFQSTPNAVHHRITRLFFTEGPLLQELLQFFEGTDIASLPLLRVWKAKFRFIPCNERTIEAKHAVITKGKKKTSRWSVNFASMHLRQPIIQQLALRNPEFLAHLALHCDRVRNTYDLLNVFELEQHTTLQKSFTKFGYVRQRDIALVLYHADLETRFNLQLEAKKAVEKRQKMIASEEANYYKRAAEASQQRFENAKQRLLWRAASQHFETVLDATSVYACKQSGALKSLSATLAGTVENLGGSANQNDLAEDTLEAFSKSPDPIQENLAVVPWQEDGGDETESGEVEIGDCTKYTYFIVLDAKPQSSKVVKLGAGVAGRLQQGDMSVAVQTITLTPDGEVMAMDPFISGQRQDATQLVQTWHVPYGLGLRELSRNMVEWSPGQASLSDFRIPHLHGMSLKRAQEVMRRLANANAWDSEADDDSGASLEHERAYAMQTIMQNPEQASYAEALENLQEAGFTKCVAKHPNYSSWVLTSSGRAACVYQRPLQFRSFPLRGRSDLALQDCTTYELVLRLHKEGWSWRELPKRHRSLSLPDYLPLEAAPMKIWYVRETEDSLNHTYLQCLCTPRQVWQEYGIEQIMHLKKKKYYALLLKGDVEAAHAALEDAPRQQPDAALEDLHVLGDASGADPEVEDRTLEEEVERMFDQEEEEEEEDEQDDGQRTESSGSSSELEDGERPPAATITRAVVSRQRRPQNGNWVDAHGNAFRWGYTPKDPHPKGKYTVVCPHHHEGFRECNRSRTWQSSEDRSLVILQLMHWCCAATHPRVSSRRAHMQLPITADNMPEPDIILRDAREAGFNVEDAGFCPLFVDWDEA